MFRFTAVAILGCLYVAFSVWIVDRQGQAHRAVLDRTGRAVVDAKQPLPVPPVLKSEVPAPIAPETKGSLPQPRARFAARPRSTAGADPEKSQPPAQIRRSPPFHRRRELPKNPSPRPQTRCPSPFHRQRELPKNPSPRPQLPAPAPWIPRPCRPAFHRRMPPP